ncbi:MAG TPA: helix-turn-helix domain-containing protein, partial [Polyangiaceae bacterium]|nr:helix-turn-helix domain-containing protein [Polyangiaceae bacterium]
EHAGLSDLFAPLIAADRVLGVLLVGPFATAKPTSASILERWRWLTRRQGHPADPEFLQFVSMTLSTLVLEPRELKAFERLITLLGLLIAAENPAETLCAELDTLATRLELTRQIERVWDAARSMVDERTTRTWATPFRDLASVGLRRVPERVLVGLTVSRERAPDPVDELLRRDAFQRASVGLARAVGNTIAGQVGDHGVMFLSAGPGSEPRRRQRLLDLADKAGELAAQFGFRMHFGLSGLPSSAPLWERYPAALASAESALSQGLRLAEGAPEARSRTALLHELRRKLAVLVEQKPDLLPAQFDRYLESVGLHCGYQLGAVRAHLEAAFERLAETLLDSGALEPKSFQERHDSLDRAARDVRTVAELFVVFRQAVRDLSDAVRQPVPARRERNLRRAVAYLHQHYAEPLSLSKVARIAGFAPNYFSVLFRQRERTTFEHYVQNLRIERAKQLLSTTELEVQKVAQLSGFNGRAHFTQVFKRLAGVTPIAHRRASVNESRPR